MADDYGYDSFPDAGFNEEDEPEISYERLQSPERHGFRPTLADDLKVGFFSLDRATQTEESEIVHLKEMTEVIQQLLKDAAEMKRDINFARHVMKADFTAKLQQKSIDLYCRVNEKIADLEKIHEERTATVRRAFKQQLSDALSRMQTYYMKDMEARLGKDEMAKHGETARLEAKCHEMTSTIQRNESIIHMLKAQVEQYQRQLDEEEEPMVLYEQPPSRSESMIIEMDNLKEEISKLEKKCEKMEKLQEEKKTNNTMLNAQIQDLVDQLEREKVLVQQFKHERDEMLNESASEKRSGMKKMESQLASMQKEMEDRIQLATEKSLMEGKEEAAKLQQLEQAKHIRLLEEKAALEKRLSKALNKAGEKSKEAMDLERVKRSENKLVTEVTRLKKEIDKVHKTWEKKFTILQHSLHALKDESYLRQTLQKQAAQLHQASISYAPFGRYSYDSPMGIVPNNAFPPNQNFKKPLPDIPNKGSRSPDAISYTVSAPSGRNTPVFEPFDELQNQVMSEGELDLPPEFVPLPLPPQSAQGDVMEESRAASTCSHVVVLPSATVQ